MIAGMTTQGDLVAWARERWRDGIETMRGAVIEKDGERIFLLPGDPDYPGDES